METCHLHRCFFTWTAHLVLAGLASVLLRFPIVYFIVITEKPKVRWKKKQSGDESVLAEEPPQETQETQETQENASEVDAALNRGTKKLLKKSSWGSRLLKCCTRDRETSDIAIKVGDSPKPAPSSSWQKELKKFDNFAVEEERIRSLFQGLRSSLSEKTRGSALATKPVDCFGFPNIGQSCYMNSSLQSLLALEDFISDIVSMEKVWSLVPEAQLMRTLVDIKDTHTSTDAVAKRRLLCSFKKTVSDQAPTFRSNVQNDAYEFLTSVLAHMRGLSPLLQKVAACMGTSYTCPVETHLVFKMDISRTCKSCDVQSLRQEEFTNLSLDLVPEATVEQMLQLYLTETELEFRCNCGGTKSGQRFSFATLPKVLLLHLKRFRCTSVYKLEKAYDPIRLPENMVVYTTQGNVHYSLISSISHFGFLELGHYTCDSVHPENNSEEPSDRWLTFNDSRVYETSWSRICKERQQSAYILFYKKRGVQERWTEADELYQGTET